MVVRKDGELSLVVGGTQVWVARLLEDDVELGYRVKMVPFSGSFMQEFITKNGEHFSSVSSSISADGTQLKSVSQEGVPDERELLVLRNALEEWKREVGCGHQLRTFQPVAVKVDQNAFNAPEHANWATVTCEECGDEFALGFNRNFGDASAQAVTLLAFKEILLEEHSQHKLHNNAYRLDL